MKTHKKKHSLLDRMSDSLKEVIVITVEEFRHILKDPGVLIILIAASLVYPPLYNSIYKNEVLTDVPIAVVDQCHTSGSRELLRHLDATPDLKIAAYYPTMKEAKNAFDRQCVHGIICIPADYSDKINHKEQATISMYSDMSSFLYYRAMMAGTNMAVLDQGDKIRLDRLNQEGVTGQSATITASPLPYSSNILFNGGAGFASFLMPAILILIIHQTLFFGIGMQAGTIREENRYHLLVPANRKRNILQIIFGKATCYFSLYILLSVYILGVIPRLFGLPHIGNFMDIMWMMIPFLLATIFFSMTFSIFVRNRETGLVVFLDRKSVV